jgi:hypothetical protein
MVIKAFISKSVPYLLAENKSIQLKNSAWADGGAY